jgi:RNA polymerase sigma-B factor
VSWLCISGALQHHLRDRVRLVRAPRRLHEQGQCPLRHFSLDASFDGEPCLLDQRAASEAEPAMSEDIHRLALGAAGRSPSARRPRFQR